MNTDGRQQEMLHQNNSDDIDLMELFEKIWEGRLLIGGIVLASAILAFVVIKMSTSYYSIEATIDVASEDQLRAAAPSYLRISESQAYSADEKQKSVEYQVSFPDAKKIYDRVALQLNSVGMLKSFWEKQTGVVLNLKKDAPVTEDVKAFKAFYKSFTLQPLSIKTPDVVARKFSIEYPDSVQGVEFLEKYIRYVNDQAWLSHVSQLEVAYSSNLGALNVNYTALNLIEQRKLGDKIIGLRESLKVAESLGIKETPFKELENIQLQVLDGKDYLLGTKPLAQQIQILEARQGKSLAPFSNDLRNMETWKEQMTSDIQRLKELNGKVKMFALVNAPEASLDPIKPKKALIFIAVVLLSFIFAVVLVVIRASIKARKLKAN